jgi:hypothetical protein
MPQLTFPITKLGLCVDVKVNHDAATLQGLQAAGHSLPNSIQAKALIDTGADRLPTGPS